MSHARPFYFRHFIIRQDKAAMKVGTDAMLLGAWASAESALCILDIGTGTGVLALMLAQRSRAMIDAIEIDIQAAEQARQNAAASCWAGRIRVHHSSLQQFSAEASGKYDLIISNPPYHQPHASSKASPASANRKAARQQSSLSLECLALHTCRLLSHAGTFYCILPPEAFDVLRKAAEEKNLFLQHGVRVYSRPGVPVVRVLGAFGFAKADAEWQEFNIRDSQERFSADYIALTLPYHAHDLSAYIGQSITDTSSI